MRGHWQQRQDMTCLGGNAWGRGDGETGNTLHRRGVIASGMQEMHHHNRDPQRSEMHAMGGGMVSTWGCLKQLL